MAKPKNEPIKLTGDVYCSWNVYSFVRPVPRNPKVGDLIIWSWSGDPNKPSSRQDSGKFRVSVYDGKVRRNFTVYQTRLHTFLQYSSDEQRGRNLRSILSALVTLKSQTVVWNADNKGYEVYAALNAQQTDGGQPAA